MPGLRSLLALLTATATMVVGTYAQEPAVRRALETITEQGFRTKLAALAHDSTRGRETPTPELEKATAWVAEQFRHAGVSPAGDGGDYLQRFRVRRVRLDSATTVTVQAPGASARWALGTELVHATGSTPADIERAPVVLMSGLPTDTARPFGDVSVEGAVILHVIAREQLRGPLLNPVHEAAQQGGALAHVLTADMPEAQWISFTRGTFRGWWEAVGAAPRSGNRFITVYGVRIEAAAALLEALGEDAAAFLQPERHRVRVLDGVALSVTARFRTLEEATVANVVGVLEGSDPTLREEAVIFTGHMDHVGTIPGRCYPSQVLPADSICNGADDNASGTVGVIELAEAFAALEPRPARTLVFAAVTAEERGLFGSLYYVAHPVMPVERTVAAINLDMIARNPPDTVGFLGKDYTSLGGLVDRLAREHAELRLTPAEHQGRFPASDHFPFVERGVPALFFFSGEHEDLHEAADNPDRADAEQAARIVRLAFLVGLEVANAARRPTWDPDARARYVSH